jgi:molybdopterin synthase catalytic subunit
MLIREVTEPLGQDDIACRSGATGVTDLVPSGRRDVAPMGKGPGEQDRVKDAKRHNRSTRRRWRTYDWRVLLPPAGDDWVALSAEPLPYERLATWPIVARCGAVVVFAGTVRDHAEDRPGVLSLEYEAYADAAIRTMEAIVVDLRERWPCLGRIALLHRTGVLAPPDVSVVVSVSAPHRPEAFDAARWGIDTIKARVPIWKRESWEGGSAWGLDQHPLAGAGAPRQSRSDQMSQAE